MIKIDKSYIGKKVRESSWLPGFYIEVLDVGDRVGYSQHIWGIMQDGTKQPYPINMSNVDKWELYTETD